jgi:hypothetical protein
MGFKEWFFTKPKPILNEEDLIELKEIKRKAYMDEAKKIVEVQGKLQAKLELEPKKPKESF